MGSSKVAVQRPQRWDLPFSAEMSETDVARLMAIAPFRAMNEAAFSPAVPLRGILQKDCRLQVYEPGDVVIRQGDYGNSAFLILQGTAVVTLAPIAEVHAPAARRGGASLLAALTRWVKPSRVAESRSPRPRGDLDSKLRGSGEQTRMFVQDIPAVHEASGVLRMRAGELFGELAALTRTSRSATVIAESPCEMLEIRWQGLRDLMKRDAALANHIEALYRRNSLFGHFRLTPVIQELDDSLLHQLAGEAVFESHGEFEWNRQFRSPDRKDIADRILDEPVVAAEGDAANSLYLIRNGFARISREYGSGHRTIAYLGKGQVFGLREMAHNWRSNDHRRWTMTMRAVGYLDVIRIPQLAMEQLVFPNLPPQLLPAPLPDESRDSLRADPGRERRTEPREPQMETGLLEFLVEGRLINGSQAMVIDLDRCTRCDDCVRACAAVHDNNPRFAREGLRYGKWMFANACMHCLDPVCMIGCPTGAIARDQETGHVLINDATCIGCGTCAASCPYQNIRMVEIRSPSGEVLVDQQQGKPLLQATKCDYCHSTGSGPACQRACPHDALVRIDLTQPLPLYQLSNSR